MGKEKKYLWGGHLKKITDKSNVTFCSGRDVSKLPMADEVLLPYDIWTNRAHSIMLNKQGILKREHLKKILKGLDVLEKKHDTEEFSLDPDLEDVHSNIESFITSHYGIDVGGRMHIGRSRNDQSVCDMRLFLRKEAIFSFFSARSIANE